MRTFPGTRQAGGGGQPEPEGRAHGGALAPRRGCRGPLGPSGPDRFWWRRAERERQDRASPCPREHIREGASGGVRSRGGWAATWGEAESQAGAPGRMAVTWNSRGPRVQSGPTSHPAPESGPDTPLAGEGPRGGGVASRGGGQGDTGSSQGPERYAVPPLGGAAGASWLGLNPEHTPERVFPSPASERLPRVGGGEGC